MQTNYERGRAAEYHVKRLLEEQGYRYIIRSAASHTPIDLLAAKRNLEVLAVQVKVSGYLSENERKQLIEWAEAFHALAVLAGKKRSRWTLIPMSESASLKIR